MAGCRAGPDTTARTDADQIFCNELRGVASVNFVNLYVSCMQ